MEAYYLRRTQLSMHVHKTEVTDFIYFPDQKLVLYRQSLGSFSGRSYSIDTTPEMLEEAQLVVEGKFDNRCNKGRASYGSPKKMEVDSTEGMSLIEDAKKEKLLRLVVEGGIEHLIDRGNK